MAVLEGSMSSSTRENTKNKQNKVKNVLLVAQELKLTRALAGNSKIVRDRALKSLKKWFRNRGSEMPFTDDDFLRLWKGLFYSMWMSDKPLIQEECAENIGSLVHELPYDAALQFYKCGVEILINEWFGIDQLRLDKFLMFVRRLLRQILFVVKTQSGQGPINKFAKVLSETILDYQKHKPLGLLYHFIEIFPEELAKVYDGELAPHLTTAFLIPFMKHLAFTSEARTIDHIKRHIFIYLIKQSDLGLEYSEKYKAWRQLGFPGTIHQMQKVDEPDLNDHNEADEPQGAKVLDPRAGRVNVDLAQIKFQPKGIARILLEYKQLKETSTKSRKCFTELSRHFLKLSSGVYPLGVKKLRVELKNDDTNIKKAANRLFKFNNTIVDKDSKKRKASGEYDNQIEVSSSKKNKLEKKDDHDIELRSGKKLKLDNELFRKLETELHDVFAKPSKKKLKRKVVDSHDNENMENVESIFERNSGLWFVRNYEDESSLEENKSLDQQTETSPSKLEAQAADKLNSSNSLVRIQPSPPKFSKPSPKKLFPSTIWDNSVQSNIVDRIEESLKKANQFPVQSTPNSAKKVKINTNLNRSQDVHEHHAQILSSPAIPYDANKKPSKPLLKTPTKMSPINPFYSY